MATLTDKQLGALIAVLHRAEKLSQEIDSNPEWMRIGDLDGSEELADAIAAAREMFPRPAASQGECGQ